MGKRRKKKHRNKSVTKEHVVNVQTKGVVPFNGTQFKLLIPEIPYKKVMYWINKSTNEVSGFGSLDFDPENGTFTVRDVMLLEQEVSGGSTEITPQAMGKAMFKMRDEPNALKWHWHSHPTFGCFWSGTDMDLIRELGQRDWILASVFNQKREYRTAFLQTVDVLGRRHDVFVDEIPTKVIDDMPAELMAQCDQEFEQNVKAKAWGHYYGGRGAVTIYDGGARRNYTPAWLDEYNENKKEEWRKEWRNGQDDAPVIVGAHHRRSARPVPRVIADDEYTDFGFAVVDGKQIYNPLKDRDVKSTDDLYLMISDMEPDEIEFLRECDPLFCAAVKAYIISKARETDEDKEAKELSEAAWPEFGVEG